MYIYTFSLRFAKQHIDFNFNDCKNIIEEAIDIVNNGIVFRRDKKFLEIISFKESEILIKLTSRESLINPVRSLSGITRYIMKYYTNIFKNILYNRILFSISLLSENKIINPSLPTEISNEDLLKGIIDLLYGYTSFSNSETLKRDKTIKQMKNLILPYLKINIKK